MTWAGGRGKLNWVGGGVSVGDPCQARAHHGFNGIKDRVVGLIADFAR